MILKGVHGEGTDRLEHSHRAVCRMVGQNKEWLQRFMPEITWGKIIALFKQPKTTMWKKGIRKEGRTRIISGKNFDLALGSMFS